MEQRQNSLGRMKRIITETPEKAKELELLSESKLEKAHEILIKEMMSSEEEDVTDVPLRRGRPQRIVKHIAWESKKSKKNKRNIR